MIELLKENYSTFINVADKSRERHWPRLFAALIFSLLIALLSNEELLASFAMMATSMTVLTGFTFTALFSDHALANSGLPKPITENDRHDFTRLRDLAKNFQLRVSYFIALSTIEIVALVMFSFKPSVPNWIVEFLNKYSAVTTSNFLEFILQAWDVAVPFVFTSILALLIFTYLECLYIFYRLSETIIAIVRIRREYLAADRAS